MTQQNGIVLILGSAPSVTRSREWDRAPFDTIVAINNAWAVRPDWDLLIYPEDFALQRLPQDTAAHQRFVTASEFVPAQNRYGGFVFAGGTMAFTTAYWVLDVLRPRVLAFLGCDMVYSASEKTHFYGQGTADPLREDVTLRDLPAKSARLGMIAAAQGCACVNLSDQAETELVYPRATPQDVDCRAKPVDQGAYQAMREQEGALGYETPSGRYWETPERYDPDALAQVDAGWRRLYAEYAS